MNFNQIKEELKEQLGNHCHYYNEKILCFTRCDNISNDICATIREFDGEANSFLVEYRVNSNNVTNTKKYKNIDDFIFDFITIRNAAKEMEKVYNSIIFS